MPPSILLIGPTCQAEGWLRADPYFKDALVERAQGNAHALRHLRQRAYDVVITDCTTAVDEDLALIEEMRHVRPQVKVVLLTPAAAPEELIRALRAHVFAVFDAPFEPPAVAEMIRLAILESEGREGIEVLAATRNWVTLRIDCRQLTAERVLTFLDQLRDRDIADRRNDHSGIETSHLCTAEKVKSLHSLECMVKNRKVAAVFPDAAGPPELVLA